MKKIKNISLSMAISLYTASVIALGMAFYAVYQYFSMPGMTVLGLVIEHGWHVIVLGIIIYLTLYAILNKKVVQPLVSLYVKIYAITKGDFSPVVVDSNILEIQEMAEGITFLLNEIKKSVPKISLLKLSRCVQELRSIARQEADTSEHEIQERLAAIANIIDKTEKALSTNLLLSRK